MIDKKELRIGNLITDIHSPSQYGWEVTALLKNKCHYGSVNYISPYKNIVAIPLTEEWLIKFGFVKESKNWIWFILTDDFKLRVSRVDAFAVYINERQFRNEQVKYVHQLQNLIFALTGKELVIS